MHFSPYLPHVLASLALTSISIHLVGRRRAIEDERARAAAQLSILTSIRDQLKGEAPLGEAELGRLKRLARASAGVGGDGEGVDGDGDGVEGVRRVPWGEVFRGKGPASGERELSKWDRRDLEMLRKELDE
ncbi:hypothetical protein BJ912DRAFT_889697 [Pholiota molesta]|nr:hypothetical protein BJ912DRAFT_889697 [Pholiota molesta]